MHAESGLTIALCISIGGLNMKPLYIHKHESQRKDQSLNRYDNDFYEFRPYFYAIFAVACFYYKTSSPFLVYSGALFAVASAGIFYMRYFNRHYR
jgi:uncharacterized membrane protein